jgi:hypothetical protein
VEDEGRPGPSGADFAGHQTTRDWTTADPDRIDAVADEITTLSAHIHAATHRLLTLIAEFDRLRGWERDGHRSCAHWLAFNTGIDLGAAREKVRAARVLEGLPETGAAMARGALSFAKVRALTRVATAENEGELLELARGSTAAALERMVRAFRLGSARDEIDLERIRHRSRTFSVFPGDDGMYVVRGRLDPEVGALLMRAVEAANDALYRRSTVGGATEEVTPQQRRADALGLLAERAMAVGFGGTGVGLGDEDGANVSGSRAERYQVLLHVDAAMLGEAGEHGKTGDQATPCRTTGAAHAACSGAPGRSHLHEGTRVSAETSRRLACDSSLVQVHHDPDGRILDVGRRTRTIPSAIRRALEVRDRGCVFPGCGLRFTDAHHVVHWADGGETKLDNLVLLCRHHHRLLHEEGYRLELNAWEGGRPVFYDRQGLPVPDVAPVPEVGARAVATLIRANRNRGVRPDWRTASCRWECTDDVPLDVLERAEEAA